MQIKKHFIFIILFFYLACGLLTICYFDGTGDAGDSILHYLFARYAFQHPGNLFDHWAKPVFVLLSSPFAQFGFSGMKLFNLLVTATAIYITYLSCNLLKINNGIIVTLLMIFAPYAYAQTFSGLTESLFALFLITGIYLVLKQMAIPAAFVISFLPFVRSEGLLILLIFALYFVVRKKWKCLLFLVSGHVLYSIAGFFIHHDFLWVFSKIPYTRLSSAYGSGDALHFVNQLMYVVGVPVYILFWLGIISYIPLWISKKEKFLSENTMLVLGCALTFIIAHSLFWALGIFNSMGLKRVLIGIMPLTAIISLRGFNFMTEQKIIGRNLKYVIQLLIVVFICLFPFTKNPAALDFKNDLSPDDSQKCAWEVTKFVKGNFKTFGKMYYSYPYFSETFGIDYFDKTKHLELKTGNLNGLGKGDLIIWDDWFALHTSGITTSHLEHITGIEKLKEFKFDGKGTGRFILYRYD